MVVKIKCVAATHLNYSNNHLLFKDETSKLCDSIVRNYNFHNHPNKSINLLIYNYNFISIHPKRMVYTDNKQNINKQQNIKNGVDV